MLDLQETLCQRFLIPSMLGYRLFIFREIVGKVFNLFELIATLHGFVGNLYQFWMVFHLFSQLRYLCSVLCLPRGLRRIKEGSALLYPLSFKHIQKVRLWISACKLEALSLDGVLPKLGHHFLRLNVISHPITVADVTYRNLLILLLEQLFQRTLLLLSLGKLEDEL